MTKSLADNAKRGDPQVWIVILCDEWRYKMDK